MYIFQSVLRVLINLSVLAFAENPIAITNVEKIEIIYLFIYEGKGLKVKKKYNCNCKVFLT